MKRMIEYYYNFKNIDLNQIGDEYYFKNDNKNYIMFFCRRSEEELDCINNLLYHNRIYNKLVPNIFNQLITYIDGKKYVLVEKINNYSNEKIDIYDVIKSFNINKIDNYNSILRTNWYYLWTKKIDYIVYQKEHIKGKYSIIEEYLDYYIGMAESAVSYYKNTIDSSNAKNRFQYILSHRRIKSLLKVNYYNIDDLIIDYPARNVSEYLKTLFYKDLITNDILNSIFSKINYDEFLYRILFARMLFPSNFFDIYEKVVNDKLREEELIPIINKINRYEEFMKNLYLLINKKARIPQVDWLS